MTKADEWKHNNEQARQYAESVMRGNYPNGWDRNEPIHVSSFYTYYIEYLRLQYGVPNTNSTKQ